jgi:hypothetical protein
MAPPQVPTAGLAGLAMIIPAGILSEKVMPVSGVLLGFIS